MVRKFLLPICAGAALALISPIFLTSPTRTTAQDKTKNASKGKITVLANLPLPGAAVRQIFLQQDKGKRYLYLQQRVHFILVDVTDPKNPRIVERGPSEGKLTDVGAGLAIAVQGDQSDPGNVPTQTVRLVDLSDPKNPHTAKKFEGVTSMYSDDGRQLIYITNGDGLWIIKHSETYRLPLCNSDSEENPVAECR